MNGAVHSKYMRDVPIQRRPTFIDAVMIQNQWYDAWTGLPVAAGEGSKKHNVEVWMIALKQDTAAEDIQIRFIIDDVDDTIAYAAGIGTQNYVLEDLGADDDDLIGGVTTTAGESNRCAYMFKGRSVQIMYRKTSNTGANKFAIKIYWRQQ